MRIIGVLDLRAGRAVHARGGQRDRYEAVTSAAGVAVNGDPLALAHLYVRQLGVGELYVADLDSIAGGTLQADVVRQLARLGVPLWVDAGATTVDWARRVLTAGASHAVVGLETLQSFEHLRRMCDALGGARLAFSLDLRQGVPVVHPAARIGRMTPEQMATRAVGAGVGAIIVLDLARVGSGTGIDVGLMTALRAAVPGLTLLAGGGARGQDDLDRLAAAGVDGVLVATALHDGRLGGDHGSVSR